MTRTTPYTALAPFYDRIMSHVNYDLWLGLIRRITARYFPRRTPSVLELGAGTGTLARKLHAGGYPYTGSDLSAAMCAEARRKGVSLVCADARCLPLRRRFSLIIFLYDGINYLSAPGAYRALFLETHRLLDDNGFFLFDITTENNSQTNFFDVLDTDDFPEATCLRHSYFDGALKTQHHDFTIRMKAGNGAAPEQICERHVQRIFSVEEILRAVPRERFAVAGTWHNFTFEPCTGRSERIHLFLRKKGGS